MDIVIIAPQSEEYRAIIHVFSVPSTAAIAPLPCGGTYVISKIPILSSSQPPMRLAIACVDDMYNYPCLALTERMLEHTEPELVFLLGSACGNYRKVHVCDVVVTTSSVAYLGRGRRQGQTVNPRPYTESIPTKMKDAITNYFTYRMNNFNRWNRRCRKLLRQICKEDSLPDGFSHRSTFEIKPGVIASDDLVLSWSDEDDARRFWAEFVLEEAKAYDMESAGFSHACARRTNQLNWAVIRGISDHGIEGRNKFHLAATTIAAEWLRGFIADGAGGLLEREPQDKISKTGVGFKKADLRRLYSLLKLEQKSNRFVGKRYFIKMILGNDTKAIMALQYAISRGEIQEYEIRKRGQTAGRATTAIRLDKSIEL